MLFKRNNRKADHFRPWLVMIAFLFFALLANAQYSMNERCIAAYNKILRLHFKEAHSLLNFEKTENPSNPIPVYLDNYIDFLTLFIGEERTQYDHLKNQIQSRITLLEKGNRNSPLYLFTIAEVNLQWAFIRLKFGDYTTAALEIRRSYQQFSDNQKKFPDFIPNQLGLGIIHIIAGLVPENYRWVAKLAGINGSVEQGLSEINNLAYYDGADKVFRMFRQEAVFYLSVVSSNLTRDKITAMNNLQIIETSDSLIYSPLFVFTRVSLLMKNGQNDKARQILETRITNKETYPFYYLDYLEGMSRLNKLDLKSGFFFQKYLTEFKGINYIKAAYQKLAWIGLLKGDTSAYNKYLEMVRRAGNSIIDEDKQALSEAEKGILPNVTLLRARLLFDGGYYDHALHELLDNPLKTFLRTKKEFVEYAYRLGRIYHENGNMAKAVQYYRQTIDRGKTEPYYYAAAASFQMGIIYENQKQFREADSAYRLCLSIRSPEYKTSLGQKAKAGLNRLKKYTY
jgi:hypothetical protein